MLSQIFRDGGDGLDYSCGICEEALLFFEQRMLRGGGAARDALVNEEA